MRSRLALVLAIACAAAPAFAQDSPDAEEIDLDSDDDPVPAPPVEPPAPPVEPPPTPTIVPDPAPVEPAPEERAATQPTEAPPETPGVKREPVTDHGPLVGFEVGFGAATGTSANIYGPGLGSGLVLGYRYQRVALELHLRQRFALEAKDDQLRGELTAGTLAASSALLRVRLLKLPLIEVMGGPAMLETPVFIIGRDDDDMMDQPTSSELRGVGLVVGAAAGYLIDDTLAITLDVRGVVASRWELPGRAIVVPGDLAPDGGRMYTTVTDDVSGAAWTATLLLRLQL